VMPTNISLVSLHLVQVKKAGEFYTPQTVSTLLAKIVTQGKERLRSVYDPTCGSGSLLLRVKREVQDVD